MCVNIVNYIVFSLNNQETNQSELNCLRLVKILVGTIQQDHHITTIHTQIYAHAWLVRM